MLGTRVDRYLWPVAIAVWAVIALLVLAGALHETGTLPVGAWDLDGEYTPAAFWSALLLVAASVAAANMYARHHLRAAAFLAGLFAFMAVDEITSIHERVAYHAGMSWEPVYLPLALLAGIAWCSVLRFQGPGLASALFAAGAAAWFVAQLSEALQWDGKRAVDGYSILMVSEEGLEMLGSSLFALGLVLMLRRRPSAAQAPLPASAAAPAA